MAGPTRRAVLAGTAGLVLAKPALAQDDLVGWLRTANPEKLLSGLGERIRAGLAPKDLHEAFTLATAQGIGAGHGLSRTFDLVIAVDAVARADAQAPSDLRWWPWVWLTQAWGEERGGADPLPQTRGPGRVKDPANMLDRALTDWDGALADSVVAAWSRGGDPRAALDRLALAACRDARYVGRKAEHLAAAWRNLETVGFWNAELVLRSTARALCVREQPPGSKYEGGHEEALAAARRPAAKVANSGGPDAQVRSCLERLGSASPHEAQAHFIADRNKGLPPGPAWTALHVGAARLTRELPTHVVGRRAVSTTAALHALSDRAQDSVTRTTLLFRAAWRLAFFRDQATSDGTQISLGSPPAPLPSPKEAWVLETIIRGARDPKDYVCGMGALDASAHLSGRWAVDALASAAKGLPSTPSKALPKRAAKVLGG